MRAWELGLGVLIAVREVQQDGPVQLSASAADLVGWLGLAMIIVPVLVYTETTRFPGFAALLPTAGVGCLINSRDSFVNRRVLAARPMVFVGLVSYSWYLWHWPLLSFARIVCGGLISVSRAVEIALLALVLAILSYRWIEQPFRKSTTATVRIFAGYAIALMVLGAIPLIGYLRSGWPDRVPELAQVEETVRQTEHNVCLAGYDVSTPRLRAPCMVETAGPKLALLGDSHAAALGTAMRQLAIGHGYGFEELTKAACPPLPSAPFRWAQRPTFEATCSSFNRAVFQQVMTDRSITTIVLAGSWSSLCSDGNHKDCYLDNSQSGEKGLRPGSDRNLYAGLLDTISLLRTSGKHVFVVTDVPTFALDPVSIVRNSAMRSRGELASLLSPQVFSFDAVDEASLVKPADRITDSEVRQAASEGGAQIIDLARNLCPESRCRFVDDGTLLYADSNHLTPAGAEYALRGQDPLSDIRTKRPPEKQ